MGTQTLTYYYYYYLNIRLKMHKLKMLFNKLKHIDIVIVELGRAEH